MFQTDTAHTPPGAGSLASFPYFGTSKVFRAIVNYVCCLFRTRIYKTKIHAIIIIFVRVLADM